MTILKSKYNLGIMVSGNGSNLKAIIDAAKCGIISNTAVNVVISNKRNVNALKIARNAGIDNYFVDPTVFDSSESFDQEILKILKKYDVDLVILAGYLKILTNILLKAYEKRILNIHPSLLPDFGGVNMYGMKVHKAVLQNECKVSGCTVHVVTDVVDSGPILAQKKVDVLNSDTPEILANRILEVEHKLYPETINEYLKSL